MTNYTDNLEAAQRAYAAYGKTTDYKNFQGNPMPAWDDLGDTIQRAWTNAAAAVASFYLMGPETDR